MPHSAEQGNILLTSLLLLLVMNLLGIGLVQASMKESQVATYKNIDTNVFQAAESCTRNAVNWLESQNRPPSDVPHTISQPNLSYMYDGTETELQRAKLSGYSFTCTVTELVSRVETGSVTSGSEIGDTGGYGLSGAGTPRYYYNIVANANGPSNASKQITTLVSVEY